MGYACPVCDAEQADAEHLANHLAITASLGREGHEEWLAEHAPDWSECNPAELGEIVAQYAPEIETPEFEGSGHDHGHGHDHEPGRPGGLEDGLARQSRQPGRGSMTAEAETVLREARELTRQMQESVDDETGNGAESADGGSTERDGA
ncbi:DUF5810 domain-containing protein [Natronolimnohabitans innermongolicus]|uniref:Uncharacterized protein n=1 Tax=Natronolimnohabitans innermongolicus JCM 12255 TaxID=1227499 RepID=L9X105_9EURY|nr:DUF5810 domain-containing protein [Natronolimnohabitans innermongolicus]ELY54278.1 hypothetical protein C493_12764 [Natronolimnohabitans innermongolicus JCM 12255]